MKQEAKFSSDPFIIKSVEHWNSCGSNFKENNLLYKIFYFQTLNFIYAILESKLKEIFPEDTIEEKIQSVQEININKSGGYMYKFICFFKKNKIVNKSKIGIQKNTIEEKIEILNEMRLMRNKVTHDLIKNLNEFKSLKVNNISAIIDNFNEIIEDAFKIKKNQINNNLKY